MLAALVLAGTVNWAETPAVPGGCAELAAENVGKPGCFLSAQLEIAAAPSELWWHIHEFETLAAASAAASDHRWAATTSSHGRAWLYVLAPTAAAVSGGTRRAVIGPLVLAAGQPVSARFIESIFTPGMRTRVHAHPGPEAFYIVEGEQCMERPGDRAKVTVGRTYIVPPGPHLQAAAKGRRNLALVLVPRGAPWMTMVPDWTPSQFCAD